MTLEDTGRLEPLQPRAVPDERIIDRAQQLIAALEYLIQTLPTGALMARYAAKLDAQDRAAALWLLLTLDAELEGEPHEPQE